MLDNRTLILQHSTLDASAHSWVMISSSEGQETAEETHWPSNNEWADKTDCFHIANFINPC